MKTRFNKFLVYVLLALLIVVIQLGVMLASANIPEGFAGLESRIGTESFVPALLTIALNVISGTLLGLILTGKNKGQKDNDLLPAAVLLVIFPLLVVLAQLYLVIYGPGAVRSIHAILRVILNPIRFAVFDWINHSHVPAFWLGLIVGCVVRQRFNDIVLSPRVEQGR
jgi:hypothetical protein